MDWYIDRRKNVEPILNSNSVKKLINAYKENKINLFNKLKTDDIISLCEIGGKNPNATLTFFRDIGLITEDNKITRFFANIIDAELDTKETILLMMIKRDGNKDGINYAKPFVILSKYLCLLMNNHKEPGISSFIFDEYLMPIDQYCEINDEFFNKISAIETRNSSKSSVRDIWFNALINTEMFEKTNSNYILLKKSYYSVIKFIAKYGEEMRPSENKKEYYANLNDSKYGIGNLFLKHPIEFIKSFNSLNISNYIYTILHTNNREYFINWFNRQVDENGKPCHEAKTKKNYISSLDNCFNFLKSVDDYDSIYEIDDVDEFNYVENRILIDNNYDIYNEKNHRTFSSALKQYKLFLESNALKDKKKNMKIINIDLYNENKKQVPKRKHNRIIFGAPGTGKSFELKKDSNEFFKDRYERVTFHPDYTYAQFVGTYKPQTLGRDIVYEFVPGPFINTIVNAYKSNDPYLLLIEEINRANVASVFGDVFQLLDRNLQNYSDYNIAISKDLKKYFLSQGLDVQEFRIPNNMYIWATMNSADQGVYPMDTAFKRRWDFEYIGINDNEVIRDKDEKIINRKLKLSLRNKETAPGVPSLKEINWQILRRAINKRLLELKAHEDKLLGPYFIDINKIVANNDKEFTDAFNELFKKKVLMYLFDDAAKTRKSDLFSGVQENVVFSNICKKYDEIGISIFGYDFIKKYYEIAEDEYKKDNKIEDKK